MYIKKKRIFQLIGMLLLIVGTVSCSTTIHQNSEMTIPQPATELQIAFMPDVHFHDIYAEFNDGSFQGLANKISGKHATIRTLSAGLHSTRLFNENYFALLAALDDVAAKGIKLVALPGDFSDDGQQVHMRGLAKILKRYQQQYGIEFFAAPGNHDPVRPFAHPAGKADYLGEGGQSQRIFSKGAKECQGYSTAWATLARDKYALNTICSEEVKELGYQGIMRQLASHGFYPQENYRYWESPYSHYTANNYNYQSALVQADFSQRQYEVCHQGSGGVYKQSGYQNCVQVPDSSYLVEPVAGLWLLAIDANVFIPKAEGFDISNPQNPDNFSGSGNAGYNKMFSHKAHVMKWVSDVVKRAELGDKKLIAFSHFPMSEFYDGQSDELGEYFGHDNFQLARRPQDKISQTLAATGLKVHVGGHMHINDTGFTRGQDGQFLINIQAPSIAAYVPAYKILTLKTGNKIEVKTVVLNDIPRFNELFEHYQQEYDMLEKSGSTSLWNKAILGAKTYRELTNWHISELTRQRFLPQEWPQDIRDLLLQFTGQDMLVISQLSNHISLTQFQQRPFLDDLRISPQWQAANEKALTMVAEAGLALAEFSQWNGFDLAVDFYRIRNAGQLALQDIQPRRLAQYRLLTHVLSSLSDTTVGNEDDINTVFALHFGPIFRLLSLFQAGLPDDHFLLNMHNGSIDTLP